MNRPRHGSEHGRSKGSIVPKKEPPLTAFDITKQIKALKHKLDRHSINISKVAEM